jgi:hypothetical protein
MAYSLCCDDRETDTGSYVFEAKNPCRGKRHRNASPSPLMKREMDTC